jgi:hypothetical protein
MIPYTIVRDDEGKILRELAGGNLPHTVIFDSKGHMLGEVFGAMNPKEQDRIRGLLNHALASPEGG